MSRRRKLILGIFLLVVLLMVMVLYFDLAKNLPLPGR